MSSPNLRIRQSAVEERHLDHGAIEEGDTGVPSRGGVGTRERGGRRGGTPTDRGCRSQSMDPPSILPSRTPTRHCWMDHPIATLNDDNSPIAGFNGGSLGSGFGSSAEGGGLFYHHQLMKVGSGFLVGEGPCSLFNDVQPPVLSWYCCDGWE